MKVCLVNPRFCKSQSLVLQQGLLHLAAQVKSAGHECRIVDYSDPEQTPSYSELSRYDVVGLSVMTPQLRHAIEIADSLGPATRVVWGGVHCLLDPLSIVRRYPKHYVVSGDGEIPLVKLLDYFEERQSAEWLRAQEGISFTVNGEPHMAPPYFQQDLDALADIDFHDIPNLAKYARQGPYFFREQVPYLFVHTSRGCNWKCAFCINTVYARHGALHRSKSIAKIRRETERIIDEMGVRLVMPQDEDFFASPTLVRDWQDYMREKGMLWAVSGRFNYFRGLIDAEALRRMVDNGLVQLGMSVESGCERLRNDVLHKQVHDSDIRRAVEAIRAGVGDRLAINVSFLVDFPGETLRGKIETIRMMDRLSRSLNVVFSGPQPYRNYPGTALSERDKPHERGSLDFYLENTDSDGAIQSGGRASWTTLFYQFPLTLYYNRRAPCFRVADPTARPLRYEVERPRRPLFSLLDAEFLTIRLRLRFEFWRFFFEPPVIYGLFLLAKTLRVGYRDTKARIRRAPAKIARILRGAKRERKTNDHR